MISPPGARNPMLLAVRRRRAVLRRWAAWACERQGGTTGLPGRGRAAMVFLAGAPPVAVNVRTESTSRHFASTYASHLHLALNPVFVSPHRAVEARPAGHRRSPAHRPIVIGRARPVLRDTHPARAEGPAGVAARPSPMPVARAAPQAASRREGDVAGPLHRAIGDLVTRVVTGRTRVEQPLRGGGVLRERAGTAREIARALEQAQQQRRPGAAPATPAGGMAGWPATNDPRAALPVHLDQLTDQVVSRLDERLTAHRERFGRAL